eukprot:jgi/Mesen1/7368/ME000381S06601
MSCVVQQACFLTDSWKEYTPHHKVENQALSSTLAVNLNVKTVVSHGSSLGRHILLQAATPWDLNSGKETCCGIWQSVSGSWNLKPEEGSSKFHKRSSLEELFIWTQVPARHPPDLSCKQDRIVHEVYDSRLSSTTPESLAVGGGDSGGNGNDQGSGGGSNGGGRGWEGEEGEEGGEGEGGWNRWWFTRGGNLALALSTVGIKGGLSVPVDNLVPGKKYTCTGVEAITSHGKKVDRSVYGDFSITLGSAFTKADLERLVQELLSTGWFTAVKAGCRMDPKGRDAATVVVELTEVEYPRLKRVKCVNVGPSVAEGKWSKYEEGKGMERECHIPPTLQGELSAWLAKQPRVTQETLSSLQTELEQWYSSHGYVLAKVKHFNFLDSELVCNVVEGDITRPTPSTREVLLSLAPDKGWAGHRVQVQFIKPTGDLARSGGTNNAIILRELPRSLQTGAVFNMRACREGLQNLVRMQLFERTDMVPRPDELLGDDGVVLDVVVKERRMESAEVELDWSLAAAQPGGKPALASIVPGGSVFVEKRNMGGVNKSIYATVTTSNLLQPQDDLGFKVEYTKPYIDGVHHPRNRSLQLLAFNSRRVSPVFAETTASEDNLCVYVDRVGGKANIIERLTSQSFLTAGVVLEEVRTRDETGALCTQACRTLPNGELTENGPPTSHSDRGRDRLMFLQANLTRDTTFLFNGTPVGSRDILQVDQGLGIGSKRPFFNKWQLSLSRFIQLVPTWKQKRAPPPVLVLHGRAGGCRGDLLPYDAFVLGGPHSVRGYTLGELGASRKFLEVATELRVPIGSRQVYLFGEYGTDLGSSAHVRGNPTAFYHKAGSGACYGVGTRVGAVRIEWVKDCNAGEGAVFARFGERF